MGITGTASTNIAVCRILSLLFILSTFFDDNGAAGPTHNILSSRILFLPQGLVLMAEDSVDDYPLGKSSSLGAAGFCQEEIQMDSPPFLQLSKVFYTRLEL